MTSQTKPILLCLSACALFSASHAQRPSFNPSEHLFRKPQKPSVVAEDNSVLNARFKPQLNAPNTTVMTAAPVRAMERKLFTENITLLDKQMLKKLEYNPSATANYCTTPTVRQGCCYYTITNMNTNVNELYAAPDGVFATETAARNYYLGLRPSQPYYLPYSDPKVYPGGGWYYSNGNGHGSIDFSKTGDAYGPGIDPTFNVQAAADGKVVSKGWVDLFGNYIIIEHKAPNGDVYRTGYFHLRDGYDHDLQMAKAVKVNSKDPKERDSLYVLYANKPTHSKQQWGTNDQKIKVKAGDNVHAGQHIAFAGNTGYGGAGWGLNEKGDPYDPNTANNHLHFMLWIKSPNNYSNISWMEVDPYGVYAILTDSNRECLEVGANKAFNRFFAPHYPSFHNIPVEYAVSDFDYYPGMGMGLQTFDVAKQGSSYIASGSFDWGLSPQWYARINMNSQQYQNYFNEYAAKGFTPRQISVTKDGNGNPLFTVIWRKLQAGENIAAYHNMDDAAFNAAWQKHTATEKRSCLEHVRYEAGGKVLHAAVFSNINKGFYLYQGMSVQDFQAKFNELSKQGFMPINITAEEVGDKTTFGGVWIPSGGKAYMAFAELSPADYQKKFDELVGQGYRLQRVHAYANASKYIGIWAK